MGSITLVEKNPPPKGVEIPSQPGMCANSRWFPPQGWEGEILVPFSGGKNTFPLEGGGISLPKPHGPWGLFLGKVSAPRWYPSDGRRIRRCKILPLPIHPMEGALGTGFYQIVGLVSLSFCNLSSDDYYIV